MVPEEDPVAAARDKVARAGARAVARDKVARAGARAAAVGASLPWAQVETVSAPPAARRFPISKVCRVSRSSAPSVGRP